MAVETLFIADVAALKSLLRLTGATASDLTAIVNEGIRTARQEFYLALGQTRITDLLHMSQVDNPGTEDEFMRSIADSTEVLIVQKFLLENLPVRFLDGSGSAQQNWSDEVPFKDYTEERRDKELERLEEKIRANMEFLLGDESVPTDNLVHGFILEPDIDPPPIGSTIWGSPDNESTVLSEV